MNTRDKARPQPAASQSRRRVLNVSAAVIGNTLEWFDILVYAAFVGPISATFFPGDHTRATLIALGAFGTSFVVRPLGALFSGWIADRSGRRQALAIVSIMMFVGTGIIAMLPGYVQIGIAAPILLLFARLIQGFAAGGEFGSATAYLAEQSQRRRGFYASWQFASQGLGVLIAALFGAAISALLPEHEITAWAWRIPFFFGMLVGPAAYVIRYHADESPEFLKSREAVEADRRTGVGREFAVRALCGTGLVVVASTTLYLLISLPTLAVSGFGISQKVSMWILVCEGVTLLIVTPVAGAIGDRVGRIWLALGSCALLIPAPVVLFTLLDVRPTMTSVLLTQFALSVIVSGYLGALAAMLADLFPPQQRSLGLAICYNVAVMAAGAFSPLIYAALGAYVGRVAPSYYASAGAMISLVAIVALFRNRWLPSR
jgi:MHS family proline/betaine transporter-like MFS transporter